MLKHIFERGDEDSCVDGRNYVSFQKEELLL